MMFDRREKKTAAGEVIFQETEKFKLVRVHSTHAYWLVAKEIESQINNVKICFLISLTFCPMYLNGISSSLMIFFLIKY